MPQRVFGVGVAVAACSMASSPEVAWIPAGSGSELPGGALRTPRLAEIPPARRAEIPADAWERMLDSIAGAGYTVRPAAGRGAEENLGNALSARSFTEERILRASDAQAFDGFGSSVAISRDTAIVGAIREDGGAGDPLTNAGAAYVFGRDQGGANNWGELAKLAASDAQANDRLGPVAISGDTAIGGALGEDGGADDPLANAGAAYVFRESFLRFFIAGLVSEPGVGPALTGPR